MNSESWLDYRDCLGVSLISDTALIQICVNPLPYIISSSCLDKIRSTLTRMYLHMALSTHCIKSDFDDLSYRLRTFCVHLKCCDPCRALHPLGSNKSQAKQPISHETLAQAIAPIKASTFPTHIAWAHALLITSVWAPKAWAPAGNAHCSLRVRLSLSLFL